MSLQSIAPVNPPRRESGDYVMISSYSALTDQNLKSLLLTCPGERIDVNYGVGLRNYLFEMLSQSTLNRLRQEIISQQTTYIPYITIRDIKFNSQLNDPNLPENYLNVQIVYFNRALNTTGASNVTLNLV
jgi:phage baseplate assembly protein W|tara:strand:+ start:499 stop:888 length:390 start_codon:yes stop_codon:yes gene_type:complete